MSDKGDETLLNLNTSFICLSASRLYVQTYIHIISNFPEAKSSPTFVAILFLSDSSACSLWENPSMDCSRERRSILILWVNFWKKWEFHFNEKVLVWLTGEGGELCSSAQTDSYFLTISLRQTFKSLEDFRMSFAANCCAILRSQWNGGLPVAWKDCYMTWSLFKNSLYNQAVMSGSTISQTLCDITCY